MNSYVEFHINATCFLSRGSLFVFFLNIIFLSIIFDDKDYCETFMVWVWGLGHFEIRWKSRYGEGTVLRGTVLWKEPA